MRLFPGANQEEIRTFREYIERQVTTNRDLMERLLRARACQAFSESLPYSGRVLSVPVEDRRRGGNSDRRMDGGLSKFTDAFFG